MPADPELDAVEFVPPWLEQSTAALWDLQSRLGLPANVVVPAALLLHAIESDDLPVPRVAPAHGGGVSIRWAGPHGRSLVLVIQRPGGFLFNQASTAACVPGAAEGVSQVETLRGLLCQLYPGLFTPIDAEGLT